MKTFIPKQFTNDYVLVNAENIALGKLSVKVSNILRGKTKVCYTPHLDVGSSVIVINARKVNLTGKKNIDKKYQNYSGYRGGLKIKTASIIRNSKPEILIKHAVWGMLPHGRLGRKLFKKLKVYADASHPHEAQKPILINI